MFKKSLKNCEVQELIDRKKHADRVWDRTVGQLKNNKEINYIQIYQAMDACNRADDSLMKKRPFILKSISC